MTKRTQFTTELCRASELVEVGPDGLILPARSAVGRVGRVPAVEGAKLRGEPCLAACEGGADVVATGNLGGYGVSAAVGGGEVFEQPDAAVVVENRVIGSVRGVVGNRRCRCAGATELSA